MGIPVQSTHATTSSFQTSLSKAFSSNNTAGNTLIAIVGCFRGSLSSTTITVLDTANGSYTPGPSPSHLSQRLAVFIFSGCAGGANTVTATLSAAGDIDLIIAEYPGTLTIDQQNDSGGTAGSPFNTVNSGSITTTVAAETLVAAAYDADNSHSWTFTSGFTQEEATSNPDAETAILVDQSVSSTGTYSCTFNLPSGISSNLFAAIISLKSGVAPPAPSLDCNNPPLGTVGTPYSHSLLASGGTSPYTNYAIISGSLPGGLSINSSTGLISGTPTTANTPSGSSFTAQVTDSASQTGQVTCVIKIKPTSLTIADTPPGFGGLDYQYFYQFQTPANATAPLVWGVSSGSLPSGITLDILTGILNGNPPTAVGVYTFRIQVIDSLGVTGTSPVFTIEIDLYQKWLSTLIEGAFLGGQQQEQLLICKTPLIKSGTKLCAIPFLVPGIPAASAATAAAISLDKGATWTKYTEPRDTATDITSFGTVLDSTTNRVYLAYGKAPGPSGPGTNPEIGYLTYFDISGNSWLGTDTGWAPTAPTTSYPAFLTQDWPLIGGNFSFLTGNPSGWTLISGFRDSNAALSVNYHSYVQGLVGTATLAKSDFPWGIYETPIGNCGAIASFTPVGAHPICYIRGQSGLVHTLFLVAQCEYPINDIVGAIKLMHRAFTGSGWGSDTLINSPWVESQSFVECNGPVGIGTPLQIGTDIYTVIDQPDGSLQILKWNDVVNPTFSFVATIEPAGFFSVAPTNSGGHVFPAALVYSAKNQLYFVFYGNSNGMNSSDFGDGQIYYRTSADLINWSATKYELLQTADSDGIGTMAPVVAANGEDIDVHQMLYIDRNGALKATYIPFTPVTTRAVTYGYVGYLGRTA